MDILISGVAATVALMIILHKIGISYFVKTRVAFITTDVVASLMYIVLLTGSYIGASSAIIAGLTTSFYLWVARKIVNRKKS